MPDLRESYTRREFISVSLVAIRDVFAYPLNLGHSCDSHVRYNLSHFTSPPIVIAGH